MGALKTIVSQLAEQSTIITVFANADYLPVLNNWICAIKRLSLDNFLIIALDETLYDELRSREIPVILRKCDPGLKSLWVHRIAVIKEILESGYNVLHSDADAVWLKDPLAKYINRQPCDMIFSQGTIWPLDVHKAWHFVLCCGFFFIKANDKAVQFIDELFARVKVDQDDQVSVNRLLLEKNLQWPDADGYSLQYQDKEFTCFRDVLVGNAGGLRIALLPHASFQRLQDSDNEVYVKHILSAKKTDNILQVMRENKCLFIDQQS